MSASLRPSVRPSIAAAAAAADRTTAAVSQSDFERWRRKSGDGAASAASAGKRREQNSQKEKGARPVWVVIPGERSIKWGTRGISVNGESVEKSE